jgi:hypothetical protein
MANRSADILFQLIKSLEKSEKRHFKLYIKRSSGNEDLKIVQLFDALDKMQDYDEKVPLKKLSFTKPQLSNLKAHLYKQLLASLRLLKTTENTDLQLSEHMDNARLLYNKGLKHQALKILERAKEIAKANNKLNFLAQLISLEKKIETLHITRSSLEKTEQLTREATDVSEHIDRVTKLSNLALLSYRWYVENGHARNEADVKRLQEFYRQNSLPDTSNLADFYEKLYLYQSYSWRAFILMDFPMYYRYGQRWIDLFDAEPLMVSVETGHYVKGMHNLLNALFDLRHFSKFDIILKKFETYAETPQGQHHDNFRIHTFVYIHLAKINQHLMTGTFREGLQLVPFIEEKLQGYGDYIDPHRIMVFTYKIATLYFGSGDYSRAIDYLQQIINDHVDLRYDLQCYARLVHLLAHYELGNYELMESLSKSVYRFMAKMKNLTVVEEEMFKFLRKSFQIARRDIKPELEKLLSTIKHLEHNRFETRSFAYLDIISWLESKVQDQTMSEVIYKKYLSRKKRVA